MAEEVIRLTYRLIGTQFAERYCVIGIYLPILVTMSRRKAGTVLPLEIAILEHGISNEKFYGFALARSLSDGDSALTAHGTLYKALARMTDAGLLSAEWEDHAAAEAENRPRRRLYRVTGEGARVLAVTQAATRAALVTVRPVTETRVILA